MSATGVPGIVNIASKVHENTTQLGDFGDKIEDLRTCIFECLGGDDASTLADKVTSDVLSQLSSQIDDLGLAMQDSFERRLGLLDGRVQETIAKLQHCHGTAVYVPQTPSSSRELPAPIIDHVHEDHPPPDNVLEMAAADEELSDPYVDDQQEDSDIQTKYNVYPWGRTGMNERTRLHPTREPFVFPTSLQVGLLFENWHTPDHSNPEGPIPPWKAFRSLDMTLATEKTYYKAKAVVTTIIDYARKVGAIPHGRRITDLTLPEMQNICNIGVQSILEGHNMWLRRVAETEGHEYKEFKPRKLLTMSYATMAKYLHRNELQ